MSKKTVRKSDLEDVLQYTKTLGKLKPGKDYSLKQIAKRIQSEDPNFKYESIEVIISTLKRVNDTLQLLDRVRPVATDGRGCATAYYYTISKSPGEMVQIIDRYNSQHYTPLDDKRFLPPKRVMARSLDEF